MKPSNLINPQLMSPHVGTPPPPSSIDAVHALQTVSQAPKVLTAFSYSFSGTVPFLLYILSFEEAGIPTLELSLSALRGNTCP